MLQYLLTNPMTNAMLCISDLCIIKLGYNSDSSERHNIYSSISKIILTIIPEMYQAHASVSIV